MKAIRIAAMLVVTSGLMTAQEKSKLEATIIPIKTLSGDSFDRLVKLLDVFGVKMRSDSRLRTIVVYGDKEQTAEIKRVVAELDRPGSEAAIGRNMEATLTFLRCSTKTSSEATPLPADLEPVAKQLRALTQYKDIQLWDVIPLHLQEGRTTEQSTRLPGPFAEGVGATTQVKLYPESVFRRDAGRYVRFDRMSIGFKMPVRVGANNFQFIDVGLNTAGDFKEGQKSVLGKVSGLDDESAVFVVVSLKVLD